jgi:hypothetical protein
MAPVAPPTVGYARFQVGGAYHFALGCDSGTEKLLRVPWQSRLCSAILDYQTAPRQNIICACPASSVEVSIRGEIDGRRVDERFSNCLCGDGRRAARDALVVLRTHPPFQITNCGPCKSRRGTRDWLRGGLATLRDLGATRR